MLKRELMEALNVPMGEATTALEVVLCWDREACWKEACDMYAMYQERGIDVTPPTRAASDEGVAEAHEAVILMLRELITGSRDTVSLDVIPDFFESVEEGKLPEL
jgi:hypothetical protein